MNKERIFATLMALYAIYSLIANFCIYKKMTVVALLFMAISVDYIYLIGTGRVLRNLREAMIFLLIWVGVYGFATLYHGDNIGLVDLSYILYGAIFLSLKLQLQKKIVIAFVWGLSLLLLISLVEYILFETIHTGVIIGNVVRITVLEETYFTHLMFNLVGQLEAIRLRFQWLADEPGRIGTLCGMLMFLSWRIVKSRLPFYIFLVAGLLSFSLAFYIMLIVFLAATIIHSFKIVFFVTIVGIGVLFAAQDQWERLIIVRTNQKNIDNRTSAVFNANFESSINTGQIWLGSGKERFLKVSSLSSGGNAGGKVWIFEYGVIWFIIVFGSYNYLYIHRCRGKLRLFDWMFLLAFWLSFYQRQTIDAPFTVLVFFAVPLIWQRPIISVAMLKEMILRKNELENHDCRRQ